MTFGVRRDVQISGFWSYATADDRDLDGALSKLRKRIEKRIRVVTGSDASVFQDTFDITAGDDWEARISEGLDSAIFLLPVVTPRFINSQWCRKEVLSFCHSAERLGRKPALFPIYYIKDPRFGPNAADELIRKIHAFQCFDFRKLQFETNEKRVDRAIHKLAESIDKQIQRRGDSQTPGKPGQPTGEPAASEGLWAPGDPPPSWVQFVGFPPEGVFREGAFLEGKAYEVVQFDPESDSEALFTVRDEKNIVYWVDERAFRIVKRPDREATGS